MVTDYHVCQIFSRSVQGLQNSDTPKLPFPLTCCVALRTVYALPCDTVIITMLGSQTTMLAIYWDERMLDAQPVLSDEMLLIACTMWTSPRVVILRGQAA